jgi:hypothetical protein
MKRTEMSETMRDYSVILCLWLSKGFLPSQLSMSFSSIIMLYRYPFLPTPSILTQLGA